MTQTQHTLKLYVRARDEALRSLVEKSLASSGFSVTHTALPKSVGVVVDNPLTWALEELARLKKPERLRTVVSTMGYHPVYLDCLASYRPSGVVISTDAPAGLAAIYAASAGLVSYRQQSPLTTAEIRIMRLLIKGQDADAIADALHITKKTLNSHISNILCKTETTDRAQLVAQVLGYCP